jgi:pre-mRNA-splicing factor CDC5/CEF1
MEARNLRNMTIAQTPLLGEENTPIHVPQNGGTGFEGATPRHQVAFTPNPLATPRATDGMSATPLRTPMRDTLSINPEDRSSFIGETPREMRMRTDSTKRSLQASFQSLPKPENNFELLVPDDEDENEAESGKVLSEEDAAERDARKKRRKEEEERAALARRSQVVQRGLPRPPNVDLERLVESLSLEPVQRLVDLEVAQLMLHDSLMHPIPGTAFPGETPSAYEPPPDAYVAAAKMEVHRELAGALGFPDAPEEQVRDAVRALAGTGSDEAIDESASWVHVRSTLVLVAAEATGAGASGTSWVPADGLDAETRAAGYKAVLEERRAAIAREATRAAKVEKKLGVVLGGYVVRATELGKRLGEAGGAIREAAIERESFEKLRVTEAAVGPARVAALREEVERLEVRERALQGLYAELEREKREAEGRVAELEERVMEEAERLNEAALAEME